MHAALRHGGAVHAHSVHSFVHDDNNERNDFKMKKRLSVLMASLLMLVTIAAGCTNDASGEPTDGATKGPITVVSREDGSGTRGAFIELLGIQQKDADGNKIDHTTDYAEISNSTSVVMITVAGNKSAIGYISLGSLNDTVKALNIDGAAASVENIKSGSYEIARPFNIATMGEVSALAQDFINYIMSSEGQAIVEEDGYISASDSGSFTGTNPEGTITVSGSSSVTPVMEVLKEAYLVLNPNASIEIQMSDSTTGMTSALEGIADIGMASRELKDSELDSGLSATVIALDGIAIVVNKECSIDSLTSTQVRDIYMGEITDWSVVSAS